jgi:hydrogenase/urease accessory protein HupE
MFLHPSSASRQRDGHFGQSRGWHVGVGEASSFQLGFLHSFAGAGHILAMIAAAFVVQ